ncbi:MAG: hypothetical protein ACE15C_01680 [Phycisphaerae bacterium]
MGHFRTAALLATAFLATLPALGQAIRPINPDGVDAPAPTAAPKADLAAKFKQGDILFVATVDKARQVAMTSSIPPTILMEITFKDLQMLRGKAPGNLSLHYSARGRTDPALAAGKRAIVAANVAGNNGVIVAVAEATDENLKAIGAGAMSQPTSGPASRPASGPAIEPVAVDNARVAQLTAELKKSPILFTAKIKASRLRGAAKSMPPIYLMDVELEDIKALRGAAPKAGKYFYAVRQEATPQFPDGSTWLVGADNAEGTVVIKAMLEATDGNLQNVGAPTATSKPAATGKVNDGA